MRERSLTNATEMQSALAELTLTDAERGDVEAALRTAGELQLGDGFEAESASLTHRQLLPWAAYRAYMLAGAHEEAESALLRARAVTAQRLAMIPTAHWRATYRHWWLNRLIVAGPAEAETAPVF